MLAEALIGAGLVLFELVAHDASLKRGLTVSLHLINTFFPPRVDGDHGVVGVGRSERCKLRGRRGAASAVLIVFGVLLPAMLVVGASGAVAALGDTLFPVPTPLPRRGSPRTSPPARTSSLRHLRVIHPMIAMTTAGAIVLLDGARSLSLRPARAVRIFSQVAASLAVAQVAAGIGDVLTRAPVPMQLVHLVLADLVWIGLVLTAAAALAEPAESPSAE